MPEPKVINDSNDFVPMPTPDRVVDEARARKLEPIPFEFADIRALAQRILKRAQEQAQQKLEAARGQIAAMEKQARDKAYQEAFPKGKDEGFAKGEKEGMAAAETKIAAAAEAERESLRQNAQPVLGVLEQLAGIMNENRQQLLGQAEGDLLLLALDIAKRLVARELTVDPEAIRPLAIECIGLVAERSAVTVRVNPEDARVMHEILPELSAIFPDLGAVKIEADPTVERGGLTAATRESEVDMRLATRLAAFEEAILGFSGPQAVGPWNAAAAVPPPAEVSPPAAVPPSAEVSASASHEASMPPGQPPPAEEPMPTEVPPLSVDEPAAIASSAPTVPGQPPQAEPEQVAPQAAASSTPAPAVTPASAVTSTPPAEGEASAAPISEQAAAGSDASGAKGAPA